MAFANEYRFVESSMPSFFQAAWIGVKQRYAALRIREELSQLSDRDLADIGMVRGNLDDIALNAAKKW